MPAPDDAAPPPAAIVLQITAGVWTAQALFAAASLGIADRLADGPKTPAEIAAATDALPQPIYRVLRALASLGVFVEQPDGRFANTPASEALRSDVAGSARDYVVMAGQPWHVAAYGEILHSVKTGKPCADRVLGMPIWEFLRTNPEQGRIFNQSMSGIVRESAEAMRDAYDFHGVRTLVDIGGGHGLLLGTVLAANPDLCGVLFDQPHVVDGAAPTFARLGVAERVQVVGGDFFREVPRGDAYVLSRIIHDWDDARATAILQSIRRACEPGARVLLLETVIPPGNGPSFGKLLDLEMLALPGGLERTEAEYRALLAEGGFRLTRILPTASPMAQVIEAMVV